MIELLYYGVNFLNKKTVNSAVSGDKKALQKLILNIPAGFMRFVINI